MVIPIINRYYLQQLLAAMILEKLTIVEIHNRIWHIDDIKAILRTKGELNGKNCST